MRQVMNLPRIDKTSEAEVVIRTVVAMVLRTINNLQNQSAFRNLNYLLS